MSKKANNIITGPKNAAQKSAGIAARIRNSSGKLDSVRKYPKFQGQWDPSYKEARRTAEDTPAITDSIKDL